MSDDRHVHCKTTAGDFSLVVRPSWSPHGAQRFIDLISRGYYNDVYFFRKNHWIVQFGAVQHPQTGRRKQFSGMRPIADDPHTDCSGKCLKHRLWDGALSFAGGGKGSRSAQVFIVHHLGSQPIGGELWETPIGNITSGMESVLNIFDGYSENVDQVKIFQQGENYIKQHFTKLDKIIQCALLPLNHCHRMSDQCEKCKLPDPMRCPRGAWTLDATQLTLTDGICCPDQCSFKCAEDCQEQSHDCPGLHCVQAPRCALKPKELVFSDGKCCPKPCEFECNFAKINQIGIYATALCLVLFLLYLSFLKKRPKRL